MSQVQQPVLSAYTAKKLARLRAAAATAFETRTGRSIGPSVLGHLVYPTPTGDGTLGPLVLAAVTFPYPEYRDARSGKLVLATLLPTVTAFSDEGGDVTRIDAADSRVAFLQLRPCDEPPSEALRRRPDLSVLLTAYVGPDRLAPRTRPTEQAFPDSPGDQSTPRAAPAGPWPDVLDVVLLRDQVRAARLNAAWWLVGGLALAAAGGLTLAVAVEDGGVVWTGAVLVGGLMALRALARLWRLGIRWVTAVLAVAAVAVTVAVAWPRPADLHDVNEPDVLAQEVDLRAPVSGAHIALQSGSTVYVQCQWPDTATYLATLAPGGDSMSFNVDGSDVERSPRGPFEESCSHWADRHDLRASAAS